MALKRINGILRFFDCDEMTIKSVSAGRWEVKADSRNFVVVGGRKSGGARHEWFLNFDEEWHPCKSMVEAIKMGISF